MANIIHRINTSNNYQRGTATINPGNPFNQLASGNVLHRNEPHIQTLDTLHASSSGGTFDLYDSRFDTIHYYHVFHTPTQVRGLVNWWDADDASTIVIDDSDHDNGVASWTDKQGGVVVSQAVGAKQPTASGIAELGGSTVIQWDGVNDHLLSPVEDMDASNNQETFIVVGKFPTSVPIGYVFSGNVDASPIASMALYKQDGSEGYWIRSDDGGTEGAIIDWHWESNIYMTLVITSKLGTGDNGGFVTWGGSAQYSGGLAAGEDLGPYTITPPSTPVAFSMGPLAGFLFFYNFELAEVMRYNRILSFAEIDGLARHYIWGKYGLPWALLKIGR